MAAVPTGAVIALKRLDLAKSRFGGLAPALRERLALAMLHDTCAALAPAVDDLVVVTPVPGLGGLLTGLGGRVLPDPGRGLNPAYAAGAQALRAAGVRRVVAAVADLPALQPADVVAVLDAARAAGPRAYVADHTGAGTTLLVADDAALDPRFEDGSAARHAASGAAALAVDAPRARLDVDRADDLAAAAALGLGPATARLWDGDAPARHDTAVIAAADAGGWTAVASDGTRCTIPRAALGPELRGLRPTQRVHLARDRTGGVSAAWL